METKQERPLPAWGMGYGPGIMEGVLGQYRGVAKEAGATLESWVPVDLGAWPGPCPSD